MDPADYFGIYSVSGFDMMALFQKILQRPNPKVALGPVDHSAAFIVTDALMLDMPIIYASDSFVEMTGYPLDEILGRNCRFLQSPTGQVQRATPRQHTDSATVYAMKKCLDTFQEGQFTILNYRKNGEAFMNLVSIIPLRDTNGLVTHFIGLQADLMVQTTKIVQGLETRLQIMNTALEIPNPILVVDSPLVFPPVETRKESNGSEDSKNSTVTTMEYDLVHKAPDIIQIVSSRGVIIFTSPQSTKNILNFEDSELTGQGMDKIYHKGDMINMLRDLRASQLNEKVSMPCRIITKEGNYNWYHVVGHRYQMNIRKRTKSYILKVRPHHLAPVPLCEVLAQDHVAWFKVSINGIILNAIQADRFFPFLAYGHCLLDHFSSSDKEKLVHSLSQQSKSQLYIHTKDFRPCFIHLLEANLDMVRFIKISNTPITETPSFPTTSLFETDEILSERHALEYYTNLLKVQNKKLYDDIGPFVSGYTK